MKKLILLFILSLTISSLCKAEKFITHEIVPGKDSLGLNVYFVTKTVTTVTIQSSRLETNQTITKKTTDIDCLNYITPGIPEEVQVEAYLNDSSVYRTKEVWSHYDWKQLWLKKHKVFEHTTAIYNKDRKIIESYVSEKEGEQKYVSLEVVSILIAVILLGIYLGIIVASDEKIKPIKKKRWLRLASLIIVFFPAFNVGVVANIVPDYASAFSLIILLGATLFILFDSDIVGICGWAIGAVLYGILVVGIITKSILLGLGLLILLVVIAYLTFNLTLAIAKLIEKIKTIIKNRKS